MRTVACDGLLIENGKVLLVRRRHMPEKGKWAIPGGRIEDNETVEECLKRELREEIGVDVAPIRLFGVYSKPERDPRGIISLVYLVQRINGELKAGSDADEVRWFDLSTLPENLAFDHEEILTDFRFTLQKGPYRQG